MIARRKLRPSTSSAKNAAAGKLALHFATAIMVGAFLALMFTALTKARLKLRKLKRVEDLAEKHDSQFLESMKEDDNITK